jgi:hypothetical protein
MFCAVVTVSQWSSGCALQYYSIKISLYFEPAYSSRDTVISSTAVFRFSLGIFAGHYLEILILGGWHSLPEMNRFFSHLICVMILYIQAGFILCQCYVPEKRRANQNCANRTQNSPLKWCISWGLGD